MNKTKVFITNIYYNARYPHVISAELREKSNGSLCISASFNYICKTLVEPNSRYECENVEISNGIVRLKINA